MPKKDLEKRKNARKEDDDLLLFFAHKVYIAFNEDIKGSSTRPHILGTNGVG